MKLQEYYFYRVIDEIIDEIFEKKLEIQKKNEIIHLLKIKFDHKKGYNYINDEEIPIIFPNYLIKEIEEIKKHINDKDIEYNFIGTITKKREWIGKYEKNNSIIKNSSYGRNKDKKYNLDAEYYKILSRCKFTLSPTGDCPWSYRFFESILTYSIPILEKNTDDIYCHEYIFYYDENEHNYYENICILNYNKFINKNNKLREKIKNIIIDLYKN
jgi:hypothetical protein